MLIVDSKAGIDKIIQEFDDHEVIELMDCVLSAMYEVEQICQNENANASRLTNGMCLRLSRHFKEILDLKGLNSVILQGDIEIDRQSWLEHHVSLVYLTNYWITIDFSISQINKYRSIPVLIIICDPDKQCLKLALNKAYTSWA